jgi:hypothetical protein
LKSDGKRGDKGVHSCFLSRLPSNLKADAMIVSLGILRVYLLHNVHSLPGWDIFESIGSVLKISMRRILK